MSRTAVAVIGGTGLLGKYLVNGFLDNGNYDVTVITRKGGDASKVAPFTSKGAKAAAVDFEDPASLVDALKGIEILVSAVGVGGLADQPKFIEAAKAAGVKRFVPSEFGLDTGEPGMREYFPLLGYKYAARDAVEASGLEWSYIITGFFLETSFTQPLGWDVSNGKVTIKGNPDSPFTITSLYDVGKWTAEALRDPVSKNATVYLRGATLTYNEAVKKVEAVTGNKLAVTYVDKAGLEADIAAAPNPFASFLDLLLRAIADGRVNCPNPQQYPNVQPYRGPADASVTVESYAKEGKWGWEDA